MGITSSAVPAEAASESGLQERLQLSVLGPFSASIGGKAVRLPTRKAQALLAYLSLGDAAGESRERMMALLWSESDSKRAGYSLRQAIKEVNDALIEVGFSGFNPGKQILTLDRSSVTNDVDAVMGSLAAAHVHPRLLDTQRLADTLLVGIEAIDPAFQVWVRARRHVLHERLINALETALPEDPATGEGAETAQALLNLDPTHEVGCRHLMRVRVARGQIGAALQVYKALWDVLDEEYDVEPTKETQELVAQIKMAEHAPQAAQPEKKPALPVRSGTTIGANALPATAALISPRPGQATASKLIVSISPFATSGVDRERHYVVEGFRRDLIASLVRFREWLVREQFAEETGSHVRPDEYVLEAYAVDTPDDVRLVLTLRECAGNTYLWSDELRLSVATWTEAQQKVVRRIAAALNVHVSEGRMALVASKTASNLLAHDLWLRGQAHFLTYEPPGWRKASQLYREIVAHHPGFAPAYSSLAQLQNTVHFVHPGVFRSAHAAGEALSLASEATRLDPIDSRAQLCLGWANAMSGRFDEAAVHHKLACELNENDPWTLVSSALGFAFRGEPKEALALADHALELSPSPNGTHWRYQAMIRYMCQNLAGSISAAEHAESSIQNVYVWKAAALQALGRGGEAQGAAVRFFEAVEKRWFGPEVPSRRLMTRWILHGFPIMRTEDFERLRDDFGGAGAPVDDIDHNSW